MPCSNQYQRGFVLITSLVFLVVITLLAVTAMNRSTLQERMASNMRDQSRDRQAADAALREAEIRLSDSAFNSYKATGSPISLLDNYSDQPDNTQTLILSSSDLFTNKDSDSDTSDHNTAYLNPSNWSNGAPYNVLSVLSNQDDKTGLSLQGAPTVKYYVQPAAFSGRDLNPNTAAVADGTVYYRITARATQGDRAAVVTQSTYAKHY